MILGVVEVVFGCISLDWGVYYFYDFEVQIGFYNSDIFCLILVYSWEVIYWFVQMVLSGVDLIFEGQCVVYVLLCFLGYYVYCEVVGGFCFLNNFGIVVEYLCVCGYCFVILDIDVYYGNGM